MAPMPIKVDLTPKRHHGYSVVLFIFGTLFPPLGMLLPDINYKRKCADTPSAVAARFGIGSDFWLNLILTICGYIPGKASLHVAVCDRLISIIGHVHNFYIQV